MEINLKKACANINKLFNGKNDTIKFVDDYVSMILEAKRKATREEPSTEPWKANTKSKNYALELREEFLSQIKND